MICVLQKCRPSFCSPVMIVMLFAMLASLPAVGADNPLSPSARLPEHFPMTKLIVQLSESGDGYAGTISMNGKQFPAKAAPNGQQLSGVFTASGNQFDFTATLAHDPDDAGERQEYLHADASSGESAGSILDRPRAVTIATTITSAGGFG